MLPMLRAMQGLPQGPAPRATARLAEDLPANGPREHYMRATLDRTCAMPVIRPFDRQDSALLSILTRADALLVRPVNDGPAAVGTEVSYVPI